jgi:hypothetical protein
MLGGDKTVMTVVTTAMMLSPLSAMHTRAGCRKNPLVKAFFSYRAKGRASERDEPGHTHERKVAKIKTFLVSWANGLLPTEA